MLIYHPVYPFYASIWPILGLMAFTHSPEHGEYLGFEQMFRPPSWDEGWGHNTFGWFPYGRASCVLDRESE